MSLQAGCGPRVRGPEGRSLMIPAQHNKTFPHFPGFSLIVLETSNFPSFSPYCTNPRDGKAEEKDMLSSMVCMLSVCSDEAFSVVTVCKRAYMEKCKMVKNAPMYHLFLGALLQTSSKTLRESSPSPLATGLT